MVFSKEVVNRLLIKCSRSCCICHRFVGTKIEIHHIIPVSEGGDDSEENAIPLCFDCHADVHTSGSPKGRSYSAKELQEHKRNWFRQCGISRTSVDKTPKYKGTEKQHLASYLNCLKKEFLRMDWTNRYLTIRCRSMDGEVIPDIHEFLLNCMRTEYSPLLVILGEYGSGKTWICKRFGASLASSYSSSTSGVFPIVIPLVYWFQCRTDLSWEEKFSACLLSAYDIESSSVFLTLPECVLILDGLDEVTATPHCRELEKAVSGLFDFPSFFHPKIVLTCRSQYFSFVQNLIHSVYTKSINTTQSDDRTRSVLREILNGKKPRPTDKAIILELLPLDGEQIDSYFVGDMIVAGWNQLKRLSLVRQLAKKPVFLYMIEKAMPYFIENLDESKKSLKLHNIYEIAFKMWILRDSRGRNLNFNKVHSLLEDYSRDWFFGRAVSEVPIRGAKNPQSLHDWRNDKYANHIFNILADLGILSHIDDEWIFSHHSFSEYFLAVTTAKEILSFDASTLSHLNLVHMYSMNQFLISYLSEKESKIHVSPTTFGVQWLYPPLSAGKWNKSLLISSLISQIQYRRFLEITGWRGETGWGYSSEKRTSEGEVPVESLEMESFEWGTPEIYGENDAVSNVSWYDAWLFARTCGGRLPFSHELEKLKDKKDIKRCGQNVTREWCGDWYDQEKGMVNVAEWKKRRNNDLVSIGGANPDIRDFSIGFRIIISKNENHISSLQQGIRCEILDLGVSNR